MPRMTSLGTAVIAGAIWPITRLVARLVMEAHIAVRVPLSASSTSPGARMPTRELLSTLSQARERSGGNVPEARNLHPVPASWYLLLNLTITTKRCHIQRLVACHFVMNMSAGVLHAVYGDIARPTCLAAKLWACMLACRADAGTRLQAVESIVKALGVARRRAFMTARLETFVAEEGAAALRALGNKV